MGSAASCSRISSLVAYISGRNGRQRQGANGRPKDMMDYAPLTLHVPEPAVRPSGTPD